MAVNLVDLAETIENLTAEERKALGILMGNENNENRLLSQVLSLGGKRLNQEDKYEIKKNT